MTGRIRVSVVVASHRSQYIAKFAQRFGTDVTGTVPCEVIIVCDYDPGDLPQRFPRIRWVYHPDRSIPAKRNKGIVAAQGGIVAFIDDDCIAQGGWISNAVAFLEEHLELAGVEGHTGIDRPTAESGRAYPEYKRLEKRGFRTNNIFYRTSVLQQVGMFDERFTVQREDVDLAFSVMAAGYEIGYDGGVRVIHAHRTGEHWDLLKNCWNRRFDPLLFRKHPAMYRRHIRTPFTPSIGCILAAHVIAALCLPWCGGADRVALGVLDASVVLMVAFRKRSGIRSTGVIQFLREFISFHISPFVLLAALLTGSIRFRRLLLW